MRTGRGALYTGITTDVSRRFDEHRARGRKGSKYLRAHVPMEIVYRVRIGSRSLALRAEHGVKRLRKEEKERIVVLKPRRMPLLRLLQLQ